ncbi:enhanced serine sensitivity protein SseB C-terminal domain-containing protein [Gimesia sp.]|uniref:enhanced serine sensitivity protein SseB C-terminal domain-containing protein n=1 Tax=Gimesia sp. TaxID=2024833 RepID=UPI003A8E73CF
MNRERKLQAGTTLYFGVPANPMSEIMADAIGQVVAQVPGIVEAYLPQCYLEGDEEAKQVLVLGVESKSRIPGIMQDLMSKLQLVLPANQGIDMLPFSTRELPPEARIAECQIFGNNNPVREQKPWWKFW